MKKEIKISMPVYKMLYAFAFIVILGFVRGIARPEEIGPALETPVALLSAVFCADTYMTEILGKRGEVFHLYSIKQQTKIIFRRLAVQMLYLFLISAMGYGLFYWQKPVADLNGASQVQLFVMFLPVILATVAFWGMLSMTISNLCRNIWAGIGGSLLLWITWNSKGGDSTFGKWNVFSYTFRAMQEKGDWSWICGKLLSVGTAVLLAAAVPQIIKKRG